MFNNGKTILVVIMISLLILSIPIFTLITLSSIEGQEPIYLAFIWHFHQPWYLDEYNSSFLLPWVRMHSIGNYFKMAYILSKYPSVKVVFTFPGSLLKQLELYLSGIKDYRLIISEKIAYGESLSIDEKIDMLRIPGGFFDINWNRIVDIVPRYRELRDRVQMAFNIYMNLPEDSMKRAVVSEFSEQDFIDLASLFNLFWIDPQILRELYPDIYNLRVKALSSNSIHFTRDDLVRILNVHRDIMSRIIDMYKQLARSGQIELIPVPYSHPLAPIITDFGWFEDFEIHVEKSLDLFKYYFSYEPKGIWPAEQAINDYAAKIFAEKGFLWTVTDQSILSKSGIDGSDPRNYCYPWKATYGDSAIYVFFRDTELSNLISFTYSNWDPVQAVNDLLNKVISRGRQAGAGSIVVIALDGENPWENYEEFGDVFLNTLYSKISELQNQGIIRTVLPSDYISTHSEYAKKLPIGMRIYLDLAGRDISDIPQNYFRDAYGELPRKSVMAQLGEGSWAGGELAIWIGQRQENAAWMLLAKAREDLLKTLNATTIREVSIINPLAVEYLLRAEASDWFWWYGGDGGGTFPANPLFKGYLRSMYRALGVNPPQYLLGDFNPDATPSWTLNIESPKSIETPPKIDGNINIIEWRNSLNISVGYPVPYVLVGMDSDNIYIATMFNTSEINQIGIAIYFTNMYRSVSPYNPGYNALPRCGNTPLGMGLFYEIYIDIAKSIAIVSVADGRGGWIELFKVNQIVVTNNSIELAVPWKYLSLSPGDVSYSVVAVCRGIDLVASSQRLGGTHYLVIPRPIASTTGKVILDIKDPIGDDNGTGTYVYPKNAVFKPGVFDLTGFKVIDQGDKLIFYVYVRDLGGNPWNGPNGFSLQYVQIYVRTTLGVAGKTNTFGLNANLTEDSAWHFALLLAPGWGSDPVPIGERAALVYFNGTTVVQDGILSVYTDVASNAIIAEVAKMVLPDVENAGKWIYTVVLTSYDGYGTDRIRSFSIEATEWVVGVGKDLAVATALGVVPRIMDLLAPSAELQYTMLNSFIADLKTGKAVLAQISGINASMAIEQAKPITITYTTLVERSYTTTRTMTETVTTYSISTIREVVREYDRGFILVLTMLMLGIGIAIGFLVTRLIINRRRI
ncbi:glycoside hydrolase family 57 [Ignisphaera aggregans DSM 17230]|uniref:Glycoside hydrolase family 57 n=1 Tax=Ignisphaera aggregans (strain DSM 17230 / JCM 13409 / AQ1.S1) TaxID=583356 RepID=E0SSW7_IGNAA|nr:glycoside hydrolase family 57 [Ignisphaera aggregans DSM 17230]